MSSVASRLVPTTRRSLVLSSPTFFKSHLTRSASNLPSYSSSSFFHQSTPLTLRPRVSPILLKPRVYSSFYSSKAMDGDSHAPDVGIMDAVQRKLMFDDECILVDENDGVVGHESKYNCHLWENIQTKHMLHRAFSVFLFNSKYELLLQQRSATKVTFPLVWTNTCCSHPLYRESELIDENSLGVRNAAQRKLLDELGIPAEEVPVDQFTPLGRMLYKAPSDGKWGEHELDYLLFIIKDVTVNPNPDEVSDIKYVNKEQLKELLRKADAVEEGLKLSPWFRLVVDNFLYKWWNHVENGTLHEAADMKTIHKL